MWLTLALSVAAGGIALARRASFPVASYAAFAVGLALLVAAAADAVWRKPDPQPVAVCVDLSPSTRTADYRDRLTLERRIRELLRDTPYRIHFFASSTNDTDPSATRFPDLPADQTRFTPPPAAAILLFSDCRFELPPQVPPTYVVVDAGLQDPEDAAVTNLDVRDRQIAVTVRNTGGTRRLTVNGAERAGPTTVPNGPLVVSQPLGAGSNVSAELSPGDAWPENDTLSAAVPPPDTYERWWVGRSNPGPGWRVIAPEYLPVDPAAYLAAGVIVLENVAAGDIGGLQHERLGQYVRDVGGGLVILGGDRAFAAGSYEGTPLESLSPLASDPPAPTTHWVLLADGSGSMSAAVPGGTRWQTVTSAIGQLLPHLPPEDLVSVGSFSDGLQWWAQGKRARDARDIPLPPPNTYPHGPTNLQPALTKIAESADGKMPVELLVLSDFDTQIGGGDTLAALLKSKAVRLNLLAIGEGGSALGVLRQVAAATGGVVATQPDPARWAAAARELARAAAARSLQRDPVTVNFLADAAGTPPQTPGLWNRLWTKESATVLAEARRGPETFPMVARWNVGEGRVIAAAFDMSPGNVERLASTVARPPHDPRYHVTWETSSSFKVLVDAVDGRDYLNGEALSLEIAGTGNAPDRYLIPQSGPGKYELVLPAPRSAGIATVRVAGHVISRAAVPGRYAPEFDAIGNDTAAMRELAGRSGGGVITPDQTRPIDIRWPAHAVPLKSPLSAAGALCIALGLVRWRKE